MRRFRPRLVPSLVVFPALLILLSLGTWQVQRLHWKTGLIQTIGDRMSADPLDLAALPYLDPQKMAWLKVRAAGQFVTPPRPPQLYGVENLGGVLGSRLLAAFQTADGRAMLVDRGYTSQATPAPPEPSGPVEVEAVLRDRSAEHQTWFAPDNDLAAGRWYWLDMASLSQVFGKPLEPVELQLLPGSPGATPKAQAPVIDLPNNHLGYAITWYGLALALVGVYFVFSSERTEQLS